MAAKSNSSRTMKPYPPKHRGPAFKSTPFAASFRKAFIKPPPKREKKRRRVYPSYVYEHHPMLAILRLSERERRKRKLLKAERKLVREKKKTRKGKKRSTAGPTHSSIQHKPCARHVRFNERGQIVRPPTASVKRAVPRRRPVVPPSPRPGPAYYAALMQRNRAMVEALSEPPPQLPTERTLGQGLAATHPPLQPLPFPLFSHEPRVVLDVRPVAAQYDQAVAKRHEEHAARCEVRNGRALALIEARVADIARTLDPAALFNAPWPSLASIFPDESDEEEFSDSD